MAAILSRPQCVKEESALIIKKVHSHSWWSLLHFMFRAKWINLIQVCTSNNMPSELWDEITYPLPNFIKHESTISVTMPVQISILWKKLAVRIKGNLCIYMYWQTLTKCRIWEKWVIHLREYQGCFRTKHLPYKQDCLILLCFIQCPEFYSIYDDYALIHNPT